jgi:oxygen-independent coproporphyrinogen-3 oxidase
MENFMILGLRLIRGVSRSRFYALYGRNLEEVFGPALERLYSQNLLRQTGDWIALTEQGLLFGNDVFASFLGSVKL